MENTDLTKMPINKVVKTLKRRRKHLLDRIRSSDIDLTYDKQEASALSYAIAVMCSLKNCKFILSTLETNRSLIDENEDLQN